MKLFHEAQTEEDAKAAFEKARNFLWGPAPKYPKKKKLAETLAPPSLSKLPQSM